MSPLAEAVTEYLQLRRALGYKLEREGRELPKFVEFLEQHDATVITTELALAWAIQPADATRRYWNQRLTMVRRFALHLQASDPRTVGWPGASQPPAPTESRRDSLPSPGSSHRPVRASGPIAIGRTGRALLRAVRSTTA